MTAMSFGEYTWEVNPTRLEVSYERNAVEHTLPRCGAMLEAGGRRLRRVRGEGVFTGPGYGEKFSRLEDLFLSGKERTLMAPGLRPFRAVFTSLEEECSGGEEAITCRFVFTESRAGRENFLPEQTVTEQEESLWDAAFRWGKSVEELAEKNRQIFDIGHLQKGEKLWL